MLCITIAKLGGCREGKMITFPASFRSSNYNYHTDDLVSEVHRYERKPFLDMEKALNIRISVPKNWKQIRKRNHFRHGKTLDKTLIDLNFKNIGFKSREI